MPRTAFTVQTVVGPYPTLPVAADGLDITWAAGDPTNNNEFAATGRELILVRNDDVAAQTFDIKSVADEKNRTGDISTYSLGAGEYAAFAVSEIGGWRQTDGKVYIDPVSANLFFAILSLPAMS